MQRKTLNRISASLLLLTLALAFVGCRSRHDALTISLFSDAEGQKILRAQLEHFERETGIRVVPVYIPYVAYFDKLMLQVTDGKAPDVISVDVDKFPALQDKRAFAPLKSLIKRDGLDLRAHFPGVLRRFTVADEVYAVPQDTAPVACVYFNKDAFAEAGLRPPKADWKWADFLAACRALVKRDATGHVIRWAYEDNYGPDCPGIFYSNGGALVDDVEKPTRCVIGSRQNIEAIQFLADLSLKYHVSPRDGSQSDMLGLGQDAFIAGKVAMFRGGIWVTPALRKITGFNWDMVPFPSGPRAKGGLGGCGTGGSGYAISRSCKRPEDAWRLLKFLSSEASQRDFAATGFVQPSIMALAKSDVFLASKPPEHKAWLNSAVARSVYSPAHPRWSEAENSILINAYYSILTGRSKAEVVLPQAQAQVDRLLFGGAKE